MPLIDLNVKVFVAFHPTYQLTNALRVTMLQVYLSSDYKHLEFTANKHLPSAIWCRKSNKSLHSRNVL